MADQGGVGQQEKWFGNERTQGGQGEPENIRIERGPAEDGSDGSTLLPIQARPRPLRLSLGTMSLSTPLSVGIKLDELDSSVRPQDDLFRHVNGKWIESAEIPSDKARYGSFYVLAEEAERNVRTIIEDAQGAEAGTELRKIGDLFTSYMDEARIEALGAAPLQPLLAEVAAVDSITTLLTTLGRFERGGTSGFFGLFVDNDPGNPERYLVFLNQAGLGLPDESYYREEKFAEIRTKYVVYLEKILGLAGLDDAASRAARIFELEKTLASHHWDKVASRDSEATYNLQSWSELTALAGAVDLDAWLGAVDVPAGALAEVVVRQPSFVQALETILVDDQLDSWRDWLAWQVIRSTPATSAATSSRPTSTSTAAPSAAPRNCAPAGSAVSPWSRAPSARPSAASTSNATSVRKQRSRWMCSSPTSSRLTARASPPSTG